jgi:hypothetical protein
MARAWINPEDYDATPRPVVAIGNEYPPSFELDWHSHGRGQLLYAANGVVVVSTPQGAWIAPPERAVWTPAGTPHAVRMVGAVSTRSVLIDASASHILGEASQVIGVSSLLRNLLIAACDIPHEYDVDGRDGLVMALLLAELARAFRRETGMSFGAWRQQACLLVALPRLAAGEAVTTVALDLGYDSPAAFSTMFKRLLGISPNRYRAGGAEVEGV